eukprot:TRINITY_DN1558_c1_g2_i1.p1 TRINITY_DN1558_c1_g2~~TRINITY_DN1558_c1_g2_i1.p1  ORF type:complete len:193 (+),score=21.69 TRINITY_DN1558_c1_g2_i1:132-710(+)
MKSVANDMLHELKNSTSWLPPYQTEHVRTISEEIKALHDSITKRRSTGKLQQNLTAMHVEFATLWRYKRCIVAYLVYRMAKIKDLWMQMGTAAPDSLKAKLSPIEVSFYEDYDKIMGQYQARTGITLLTAQSPPKSLFVEVRVLQDAGDFLTDSGIITLTKNSTHHLRREDVELLIRQGIVKETGSSESSNA